MRALSRFEIACIVVILLFVGILVADRTIRKEIWQEGVHAKPGAGHQAEGSFDRGGDLSANEMESSVAEPGAEASPVETNDVEFSERALHMPKPPAASAPDESPSTNRAVTTTATAKPAKPADPADDVTAIIAELQKIAEMPWNPATEKLLQKTVSKWAAVDPMAALQYALQIESRRIRSPLLSGIFTEWAKNDVNAAYTWLMANKAEDPATFQTGLKPVFAALASHSIDEAMNVALTVLSGSDRLSVMRAVAEQADRSGVPPATLATYLESLQNPGDRQSFATMLAKNWADKNPQDAIQWVSSLADPALKKACATSVIATWAINAPQESAQWALSQTDPELKSAALTRAMSVWASDNPQAAANWVLSMPDGDLRNRQIAQVTQSWARYDPVKAADWLITQRPLSPKLDPAIQGLVSTVMRSNPEGAALWVTAISDPKLQNTTLITACREWMKKNPEKASAYILNAPLTPAQRARLLQRR